MTTDEKLAAILAAVQTDPGNRGLARDPHDNLFTATKGDFERACQLLATGRYTSIFSGFCVVSSTPPCFETDGPLGAYFLYRALHYACDEVASLVCCEPAIKRVVRAVTTQFEGNWFAPPSNERRTTQNINIWIERPGISSDGRCYSMRGSDITDLHDQWALDPKTVAVGSEITIGIGDGGNEIGMGKIPHETIVKNIPNGDKIHCVVPTDHLIVAGVSNWGAYALAAGIFVLKGITPPPDLFDLDREREILEVMVREGPLVDGVTGKQEATVDGLSWEEYSRPLVEIARILRN